MIGVQEEVVASQGLRKVLASLLLYVYHSIAMGKRTSKSKIS